MGLDTRDAILNMKVPIFALPADLPTGSSAAEQCRWEKKIDGIAKQEDILKSNLKILYAVIWGQCSERTRAHVDASLEFALVASSSISLALLKSLKKEAFSFHSAKYQQLTKHEAKWLFTTTVKTRLHLTRLSLTDLLTLLML